MYQAEEDEEERDSAEEEDEAGRSQQQTFFDETEDDREFLVKNDLAGQAGCLLIALLYRYRVFIEYLFFALKCEFSLPVTNLVIVIDPLKMQFIEQSGH